ncbi:MAG: MFS transporter [Anaerolineae bacterium]|nr:MFS transporter [Anaerolineae bacterium]
MTRKNGPLSLLLIAYFSFIVIGLPPGILNIAWTYMQSTFNVTLSALGLLLGVGTVGYLLSSFMSGRVIGRLGIGNGLLLGSVLGTLGMLNYVLAPTWETLLIFSFIGSLGGGILDTALNTFVSANYSAGRLNWLHAAFGVGATLGPLVATLVITQLAQTWRVSYIIALVLYLISVVSFVLTRSQWTLAPDETRPTPEKAEAHGANVSFRETLRIPMVMLLIALFFVYGGVEVSAAQLTNSLFIDGRKISQETAGFWIGVYWLSFTIGRVLMGFVADRVSTRLILRAGMIGAIIGAVMLSVNSLPALSFFGLTLIGFSLAPMFATLVAETPRRVGLRYAANTIGFEVGMTSLGIAFLPGLGGFLAERIGLELIGPFLLVISIIMFVLYELVVAHEVKVAQPEPAIGD